MATTTRKPANQNRTEQSKPKASNVPLPETADAGEVPDDFVFPARTRLTGNGGPAYLAEVRSAYESGKPRWAPSELDLDDEKVRKAFGGKLRTAAKALNVDPPQTVELRRVNGGEYDGRYAWQVAPLKRNGKED